MKFGDFELISLSDGAFRLDGGAMFGSVPKVLWDRRAPADDRNRIAMGLRPLLVRTGRHTVLIDAGVGDKMGSKEVDIYAIDRSDTLDRSLARAGFEPADIDIVIATHLHFDHAGGFTCRENGVVKPHFARARYIVRRGEWDDATHPHERSRASYLDDDFLPIAEAGQLEMIDADGDVLPGISVQRTGGHNLHHQIVRITSGGRTAVFTADMIPTTAHIDDPWVMGYDLYPMDTLAFKRTFIREAIEREYVIFFEHDPVIAAGIIRETDGRRRVERIDP